MEWFKGFVAVLIAIVFTACFIGVLHYTSFERQHSHNYSHEHSYQEDGRSSQVEPPLKTSIPVLDCIPTPNAPNICERPNKSSQNQGLSNADHYSQIVMAFFAFFGLIVGGYGLYFLWRTVEYTRKASKSAEETLTVANDTLDSTKRATRAELQPYLDAILTEKPLATVDDHDDYFLITVIGKIRITNKGKTPAIHMFGNFGFVIKTFISRGEVGKVGFSGTTESKSGCASRLGRSMLGHMEPYDYPIRFSVRFPKELFEGANGPPAPEKIRVGLGLRLSFTDQFASLEKVNGRYGRRVMEYEFGADVTREDVEPVPFLREVKPKAIDYPEEHNRLEPFIPHTYYSSGALDVIKMRELNPET